MRATISGVTHKNNVVIKKDTTEIFLNNQKEQFLKLRNKKNVIYDKKTVVGDIALNYLNLIPENTIEETLKNILLKEYYDCEKLYPYLGDYLLHRIFNSSNVSNSAEFIFEKRRQNKFISTLKTTVAIDIASWFFQNINLNRSINVEKYHGNDLSVECLNEFMFDIDYDYTFYSGLNLGPIKNYRFVIINGIIESVGEIHHLLYKANETKEPYVIFCFGMSEEVKQTIIKNNAMGRLRVYPVCLNVNDESSLNILNDLAAIHSSTVISSDLGQTISQEVRKDLPVGEKISFFNNRLSLTPVASKKDIEKHRSFLRKRIEEAETKIDVRTDVLKNRLKMFTGKRVNFYIPSSFLNKKSNMRELDYYFRFMSSLGKKLRIVKLDNQKFYIPSDYINIVENKKKSLLTKFSEIHAIVY